MRIYCTHFSSAILSEIQTFWA